MAIGTNRNGNYGGPLVNQKYKPLDLVVNAVDTAIYEALLANRSRHLRSLGMIPQPLRLAVTSWPMTIASESYMNPPLVVLSSNRSAWIKAGFESAQSMRTELGRGFQNPSDLYAIFEVPPRPPELPPAPPPPDQPVPAPTNAISPPIYTPLRLGNAGPRNIYIVVHMSEYKTYKQTLDNTGVTVVGWEFRPGAISPRKTALTGFGASRFAAIEFCKYLRSRAPTVGGNPPWNHAWLIDDNVIALSLFPGYTAVERALTAAGAGFACAGFTGGSGVHSRRDNIAWAAAQIRGGWGRQATALPGSVTPGLLQQMVLWNIDYLTRNHLNFGPVFITSGEDVSLGNYLNRIAPTPYLFYPSMTIRKEEFTNDTTQGGKKLKAIRDNLTASLTYAESATPPGTPPPPLYLRSTHPDDDPRERVLTDFIVNLVLPHSQKAEEAGNVGVQNIARSQAVEQLICAAIASDLITPATLDAAFKINGTAAQVVEPV